MPSHAHPARRTDGFTLVELLVALLVIGLLMGVALPIFTTAKRKSAQQVCFRNQRSIEGAVMQWLAVDPARTRADVAGVITQAHPLVATGVFASPPRCPSGADAANPLVPTASEGAYTLDADGTVIGCRISEPAHGHF